MTLPGLSLEETEQFAALFALFAFDWSKFLTTIVVFIGTHEDTDLQLLNRSTMHTDLQVEDRSTTGICGYFTRLDLLSLEELI